MELKNNEQFTLGYVGSVDLYYLFDNVLIAFKELLKIKPNAQLHIINNNQHDYIKNRLLIYELKDANILLAKSKYKDVPSFIKNFSAAIFFIKPTFSKKASSPTKFAEFLACGIPCITNCNIGDIDFHLMNNKIGILINSFDINEINNAIIKIIKLSSSQLTSELCREYAEKNFSLEMGVSKYDKIYSIL
jgi:glycosyltransferase involved in cell wall biosynthesis